MSMLEFFLPGGKERNFSFEMVWKCPGDRTTGSEGKDSGYSCCAGQSVFAMWLHTEKRIILNYESFLVSSVL